MALEAVVFPQDLFGCTTKELYTMGGGAWSYDFGEEEKGVVLDCEMSGGGKGTQEQGRCLLDGVNGNWDPSCSSVVQNFEEWDVNPSSSPETCTKDGFFPGCFPAGAEAPSVGRRKRRRMKSCKNKEEVENQRMTHIAVERNRRKQMNEYLAVLRSLMPASYVQRGDQASIVGGAINFVKELEQLLQSLEAQKQIKQQSVMAGSSSPFANFFTFPQYSSISSPTANEAVAENHSAIADIEVTMVESHANLKVLLRRRPKQLLRMVVGLQNLRLTTLHLNVTTIDQMVLYSFSVKVEEDCQFTTVDEIATAVYQMLGKIQEEAGFN